MNLQSNFIPMIKFCFLAILLFLQFTSDISAKPYSEKDTSLNIYHIDLSSINKFDVIQKGTPLELLLLNDISTNKKNDGAKINLKSTGEEGIKATATLTRSNPGKRFSRLSSIELATDKLFLENGQEIPFFSKSPEYSIINPPHTSSQTLGLAQTITNLSLASSPLTFGAGLGVSFLVNGILSAHQNGLGDFIWGGLNGTGLSIVEKLFRRQPDLHLPSGTIIPFTLSEDLKINQGVYKEKNEIVNISNDEALKRIQDLIKWGDLSGALELSVKTGQKEIYEEILKKISS